MEMIEPRSVIWIYNNVTTNGPCYLREFARIMQTQYKGRRPDCGRLDGRFPRPHPADKTLRVSSESALHSGHVFVLIEASEMRRAEVIGAMVDMARSHTVTCFGGAWHARPYHGGLGLVSGYGWPQLLCLADSPPREDEMRAVAPLLQVPVYAVRSEGAGVLRLRRETD